MNRNYYVYDSLENQDLEASLPCYYSLLSFHTSIKNFDYLIEEYNSIYSDDAGLLIKILSRLLEEADEIGCRLYFQDNYYLRFMTKYSTVFGVKSNDVYEELYNALNSIYDTYALNDIFSLLKGDNTDMNLKLYSDLLNIFRANDIDSSRALISLCQDLIEDEYENETHFHLTKNIQRMSYKQLFKDIDGTGDTIYKTEINDSFRKIAQENETTLKLMDNDGYASYMRKISSMISDNIYEVIICESKDEKKKALFKNIWQFIILTESICVLPRKDYKKVWEIVSK